MASMDDALRVPIGSEIHGSSAPYPHRAVSNLLTIRKSASLKGIVMLMAVALLNMRTTRGMAECRDLRFWQVYPALSRGQAAINAQVEEHAVSFSLLKDLANEAIRQDPAFLGKVRFRIDPKNRTFSIDLAALPLDLVLSKSDANAPVLEALIRLAALQRDLQAAFSGESFWRAEADAVEQAVKRCSQSSGLTEGADGDPGRTCRDQMVGSFSALRKVVISFATAKGFKERDDSTRGIPGFPVHIAVVPPRAKLKVMTFLEYKKCQYLQKPKETYEWTDLVGSTFQMIGRYRYRIEWPADLKGPEEGDIEITGPQTLTFTPSR